MKKRDYFFTNLKCILIFLVVFGHFLEPFVDKGIGMKSLYIFIYLFHMPLFVFTFGRFAKYDLKRILKNFFVPYLILQTIYIFVENHFNNGTYYDNYLLPYNMLWFIFSATTWSLLLIFINLLSIKKKLVLFFISILLAFIAGYCDSFHYLFSLSRTIVYFPFFLLGVIYPNIEDKFDCFISKFKKQHKICLLLLFLIPLIFVFCNTDVIPIYWLYESMSYNDMESNIYFRCFHLLFAFCSLILFKMFLPNREIKWMNLLGTQTWSVYCFHKMFIILFSVFGFFTFFNNATFQPLLYDILSFLFSLTMSFVCCFILTRKPFLYLSDCLRLRFKKDN